MDLWFEDVADPRIALAVRSAGGIWVSGAFGMGAPRIGGDALGDRFDVVVHMSGLADFATEFADVRFETVDEVEVPVLPLERILASKKAANRPKDRGVISVLEDTLIVLAEGWPRRRSSEVGCSNPNLVRNDVQPSEGEVQ